MCGWVGTTTGYSKLQVRLRGGRKRPFFPLNRFPVRRGRCGWVGAATGASGGSDLRFLRHFSTEDRAVVWARAGEFVKRCGCV